MYKLLNKAQIVEFMNTHDQQEIFVETWQGSKPRYFLCQKVKDKKVPVTVGRVPKNIFSWYKFETMDEQPRGINVYWEKLVVEGQS